MMPPAGARWSALPGACVSTMKAFDREKKPAQASGLRRAIPLLGFALCLMAGWFAMVVDVWWWGAIGLVVGLAVGDLLEWLVRERTPGES